MDTEKKTLRVELTINGRKVSGEPGQTILDVVRAGQLDDIPTLCHDPRLEPYGSCFLCVVEVKGSPRLLPSCVTRIRDGMEVTTRSDRIVTARKTALELLLSDHYADCVCPGQRACPAGVDIQGYLSLSALGYHDEALGLIRERNPLPVVCGRVCVRKCEVACLRNEVDEPVGINFIKRYVAENHGTPPLKPADLPDSGRSVAVVGGGPGGLSCANYLALRGHRVTIFESLPKLGGMLRYGIPEYRLPREQLDREIQGILDLGIRVETGKALGRDFTLESLRGAEGFDAVFVALGAPLGKKMGLENEDSIVGVSSALDFLRDCELEGKPELQGKVVVVGGGNSAIDAARTALRCGAEEVTIVYRRTRAEMPAHHEEVDAAEAEGAKMELLAAPLELIAENGRLRGLRCQRMELGEPDASGRRKPGPIPGAVIDIDCSYIFAAIGRTPTSRPSQGTPRTRARRPAAGPPWNRTPPPWSRASTGCSPAATWCWGPRPSSTPSPTDAGRPSPSTSTSPAAKPSARNPTSRAAATSSARSRRRPSRPWSSSRAAGCPNAGRWSARATSGRWRPDWTSRTRSTRPRAAWSAAANRSSTAISSATRGNTGWISPASPARCAVTRSTGATR
jgi:formate dehydrogenase major subunit